MSDERVVEATVGKVENKSFKELSRAERKARLVTILDRGYVNSRLIVELPDDMYGEWVVDDATEITRMQAMGFDIDTVYAPKRALHGSAENRAKVGDVIFMTAPREVKEIIDELRAQKFQELNGKPNQTNRVQKEEREFAEGAALPTMQESSASEVNATALKEAIFTK